MDHLLAGRRLKRQVERVRLPIDPGALFIENDGRDPDVVVESTVFLGEPEAGDVRFDDDRNGHSVFVEPEWKGENTKGDSVMGL